MTDHSLDFYKHAEEGHVEALRRAVGGQSQDSLVRALDVVCEKGHVECVALLISVCDPNQSSGLMAAIRNNHIDVVHQLIHHTEVTLWHVHEALSLQHMECAAVLEDVCDRITWASAFVVVFGLVDRMDARLNWMIEQRGPQVILDELHGLGRSHSDLVGHLEHVAAQHQRQQIVNNISIPTHTTQRKI